MTGWQSVHRARRAPAQPFPLRQSTLDPPHSADELEALRARVGALPNEIVDHIICELDDDALLSVAAEPPETNPWHDHACRQARLRYARGARCIYPHRPLPADPAAQNNMWPVLYREQCNMRRSLGALAPAPADASLKIEVGLQLTYALPLYGAHLIVREQVLIGPWVGRLQSEALVSNATWDASVEALLLLSLMPDVVRNSRLYHVQAAGAFMLKNRSTDACEAYGRALQIGEGGSVSLGFFEAAPLSDQDVVQHMMTSAMACSDANVWRRAMQTPQAKTCLRVSKPMLQQLASRLGHQDMVQMVRDGTRLWA